MAKIELLDTYKIPTYAICALEYGDYSGLNDEDIDNINKFQEMLGKKCPLGYILDWDRKMLDSPCFTLDPVFGLPADVTYCKVHRIMPDNWEINTLRWHGKVYPVRYIHVDGQEYLVATEDLWDALKNDIQDSDPEASEVDNTIMYYCTFDELYKLTDEELYKLTE